MRKKNLLKPNLSVHRVTDIDLAALAGKGIRGFLLDLDNTLTVWHGMQVDAAVLDWLAKGKNQGLCFCVLSNSHAARVQPMEELLGIPVLYLSAKPRKRAFFKGCEKLNLSLSEVAMVGDQLFTDIYGGNRAGLMTILTEPIDPHEMWGTMHFARPFERFVRRIQNKRR